MGLKHGVGLNSLCCLIQDSATGQMGHADQLYLHFATRFKSDDEWLLLLKKPTADLKRMEFIKHLSTYVIFGLSTCKQISQSNYVFEV